MRLDMRLDLRADMWVEMCMGMRAGVIEETPPGFRGGDAYVVYELAYRHACDARCTSVRTTIINCY